MRQSDHKDVQKLLQPKDRPMPPGDLLNKIQSEIPEYLPKHLIDVEPASEPEPVERKLPPHHWRVLAASLFVAALGTVIVIQVAHELPEGSEGKVYGRRAAEAKTQTLSSPPERLRIEAKSDPKPRPLESRSDGYDSDRSQRAADLSRSELRERHAKEEENRAPIEVGLDQRQDRETTAVATGIQVDTKGDQKPRKPTAAEVQLRNIAAQNLRESDQEKVTVVFEMSEPPQSDFTATASGSSLRTGRPLGTGKRLSPAESKNARTKIREKVRELSALGYLGGSQPPASPTDAPYDDVFFESSGVNPAIDTEDDNLSTFGLDVDTGSYTITRRYIRDGYLPSKAAIRVEEFVNFFDYGDRSPRRRDFAVTADGTPSPFAHGPRYQLLRFGIKGRGLNDAEREPATLIFVVDVSGSMARENRLGLVKSALRLLLDELEPQDRVGLVAYGSLGKVLLDPTRDKRAVERAIMSLQPGGSTNAEDGLVLGYRLARDYLRRGGVNRVILCSDGVANVGRTGPESILARVRREANAGIELTTVGFGMGNYNDVLMEQLADQGDGRYAYVDSIDEAHRIFVENLTGTLQTIARNAKVQVEFNPDTVRSYRLLGYENRDIVDRRFRDDSVDAGEIGAGHQVTALYEIKLRQSVRGNDRLATLHLRYESARSGEIEEVDTEVRARDLAKSWNTASSALRLSSVVAEFAEILKESYWARGSGLDSAFLARVRGVTEEWDDADVDDFVDLVRAASRIQRGGYEQDWEDD